MPELPDLDPITLHWMARAAEVVGALLVGLLLAWFFRRFVLTRFEVMAAATDNDVDDRLVYFLRRFYNGIVAFVLLLVVFRLLGIEISPLLAGAGIAGIAVAYAAKDILGNFLSGAFLLIDQPLKVGDRIRIENIGQGWGSWGDVIDVGLRTTTIRNTDGVYVTYPNAKLADSVIKNFTPTDAPTRFRLRVAVDPDADLERALDTLLAVAHAETRIAQDPEPSAVVRALYDDVHGAMAIGAVLELRCYVADIRKRTRLRSDMFLAIQAGLREAGVPLARIAIQREG